MVRGWAMLAAMTALALGGCERRVAVRGDGAWVRLAAVPGRPAGGYLTIHGGSVERRLVGITSPAAARIELHETMAMDGGGMARMGGGAMTMRPLQQVAVPAGGRVTFAPGGRHLMLYDVPAGVRAGTRVPLTLRFAEGDPVRVEARVIAPGDPAPAG